MTSKFLCTSVFCFGLDIPMGIVCIFLSTLVSNKCNTIGFTSITLTNYLISLGIINLTIGLIVLLTLMWMCVASTLENEFDNRLVLLFCFMGLDFFFIGLWFLMGIFI